MTPYHHSQKAITVYRMDGKPIRLDEVDTRVFLQEFPNIYFHHLATQGPLSFTTPISWNHLALDPKKTRKALKLFTRCDRLEARPII